MKYQIEDINYMVSLYCPGKCVNCNIWQYEKNEITNNEIEIEIFEKTIQSKYLEKTNYFDLTAGESQLSQKYVEAVRVISKYKKDAFLHTNISGWYPQKHHEVVKECLKYISPKNFRIDISLDGSKENYEKVRLVKNGYGKVIETVNLLKSLGIQIRLTMIVYKENYKDIPWVVDFAKELEVGYFIGYSRNAGLLQNKDKIYSYTDNELEEIEFLLTKVNWLDERRKPNWLWAKSIYKNSVPLFNCFMGSRSLVIDPYGNVFPCNECLEFLKMGNLKDFNGDLDLLLESKKALDVLKKVEKKECQPCSMLCAHKIEFPWGKQVGMLGS